MADEKKQPQSLQFQINEQIAQGIYANLAIVSNMDSEFILDFAFVQPGQNPVKVHSRIIMSPKQAKRLAVTLSNGIVQYEEKQGTIDISLPGEK
ncbi:MAG: DUF3467 domain-containing protein [Proteobacteria bacterium]|nr:DUF3467 domain-containing protein [Pseudomonadota bacterium]